MVFENWADGQPNNDVHEIESSENSVVSESSGDREILDEDAVVISSDGVTTYWHDYPIDDRFEFVCLQTDYIASPGLNNVLDRGVPRLSA